MILGHRLMHKNVFGPNEALKFDGLSTNLSPCFAPWAYSECPNQFYLGQGFVDWYQNFGYASRTFDNLEYLESNIW